MNKTKNYTSNILDDILNQTSKKEAGKIKYRMLLAAKIDKALKAKGMKKKNLADCVPEDLPWSISNIYTLHIYTVSHLHSITYTRYANEWDHAVFSDQGKFCMHVKQLESRTFTEIKHAP